MSVRSKNADIVHMTTRGSHAAARQRCKGYAQMLITTSDVYRTKNTGAASGKPRKDLL